MSARDVLGADTHAIACVSTDRVVVHFTPQDSEDDGGAPPNAQPPPPLVSSAPKQPPPRVLPGVAVATGLLFAPEVHRTPLPRDPHHHFIVRAAGKLDVIFHL